MVITYVVYLYGGNQGMIKANCLVDAKNKANNIFGSVNIMIVQEANQEEIDWHSAFDGIVY